MNENGIRDPIMPDADYMQRLLSAVTGLTAEMSRASSKDEVLALTATWLPNIVPADRASITFPVDADHLAVAKSTRWPRHSSAGDAHMAADSGAGVSAFDDEVMAFGLAADTFEDGLL